MQQLRLSQTSLLTKTTRMIQMATTLQIQLFLSLPALSVDNTVACNWLTNPGNRLSPLPPPRSLHAAVTLVVEALCLSKSCPSSQPSCTFPTGFGIQARYLNPGECGCCEMCSRSVGMNIGVEEIRSGRQPQMREWRGGW